MKSFEVSNKTLLGILFILLFLLKVLSGKTQPLQHFSTACYHTAYPHAFFFNKIGSIKLSFNQ